MVEVINGPDEGVVFVRLADQTDFERACAKDNHELRWQKVGVFAVSQSEYGRAVPQNREVCEYTYFMTQEQQYPDPWPCNLSFGMFTLHRYMYILYDITLTN